MNELKPPRLKRDWIGGKVRLRYKTFNGFMELPAGLVMTVKGRTTRIQLTGEPCDCCGVRALLTMVGSDDISLEWLGHDFDPNGVSPKSPV